MSISPSAASLLDCVAPPSAEAAGVGVADGCGPGGVGVADCCGPGGALAGESLTLSEPFNCTIYNNKIKW